MATFTGRTVNSTYKNLLNIDNSNAGIDGTLRSVQDGEGTTTTLQLSSTGVNVTSGLSYNSNALSFGGAVTTGGALTTAAAFTTSGANALTLTTTGSTNVTLPTSGTLYGTATGSITSAQLATSLTDETGSGANVFANTPTLVTPILGTPTSGTLTNCTGLPVAGLSNLGSNVGTFLITPSSANLGSALTDKTGSGLNVFDTSPTLVTPTLGVASATSINKVAITAPATSATLTIANGKTATISNTLTFQGTDSSTVQFGTGGNVNYSTVTGAASASDQETATSTTVAVVPNVQQRHPSASKAWLNFLWSSGTPTIQASYNISSLTDTGTGETTVNFTTAFSGANVYSCTIGYVSMSIAAQQQCDVRTYNAGNVIVRYVNNGSAADNTGNISLQCHGDQ